MPFTVNAMSYSIRYDNPEGSSHPWRKRRDRVASIVRSHDPDFVGPQEGLHGQLDDLRGRLPEYE